MCKFFLERITSLKIRLNLPKVVLYFNHYCMNSKFGAAVDEIMAKVQDLIRIVKMNFKTRNSSKKVRCLKISVNRDSVK